MCKWNYRAGGEDKEGWDWPFLAQIGLADLTEHHLGSNAVAPGSLVANGLSERAALELGLNCGTRVGMRMFIVINLSFLQITMISNLKVGASLIDAHAGALGMLASPSDQTEVTTFV